MTNLERLRRQIMSSREAGKAADELASLRANLLKVGRTARLLGYDEILDIDGVNDAMVAVGMGK